MKLKEIKIDSAKADVGAWVGDIPEMGDLRLKVRGTGNADYRRRQQRLVDALPRQFKVGGRVDPDKMDEITTTCLVDDILLDWEGIEDDTGKALPFSKEQARTMLEDPDLRRFRDAVVWAAGVVAETEAATGEDNAGNSPKP